MNKISIVVPCYNEKESLPLFYEELTKNINSFENVEFEIIFVNDGSNDETLDVIKYLANKDKRIKYISFSRNFGKESAIYAGLENASGDFVTLMDADLQDPPSLLMEMYQAVTVEGFVKSSSTVLHCTNAWVPISFNPSCNIISFNFP